MSHAVLAHAVPTLVASRIMNPRRATICRSSNYNLDLVAEYGISE